MYTPCQMGRMDRVYVTLGADRLGHGTRVPHPLRIHRSDDEDVDSVWSELSDGVLRVLHVISYSLPAVTHQLAANRDETQ